jgi:hypothetical protein
LMGSAGFMCKQAPRSLRLQPRPAHADEFALGQKNGCIRRCSRER